MLPPSQALSATDQVQNLILESADFEEFLNELARFSAHQMAGLGVWDRTANETGWTALLGTRRGGPDVSAYAAPASPW